VRIHKANAIPIRLKSANPERIPIAPGVRAVFGSSVIRLIFGSDEATGDSGKTLTLD